MHFYIQKRTSGYGVIRSDGEIIALGFDTSADAKAWLYEQIARLDADIAAVELAVSRALNPSAQVSA